MRIMANGRLVDVPTDGEGRAEASAIRSAAGIDPKRLLIRQQPDGRNEVVKSGDRVALNSLDNYRDVGDHDRGRML